MVDAFPVLGINCPALWSSQASWRPEAELPNSMSYTQLLPCYDPIHPAVLVEHATGDEGNPEASGEIAKISR